MGHSSSPQKPGIPNQQGERGKPEAEENGAVRNGASDRRKKYGCHPIEKNGKRRTVKQKAEHQQYAYQGSSGENHGENAEGIDR